MYDLRFAAVILGEIEKLVAAGTLNNGQGNALSAKLDAAGSGNATAAIN